IKEFTGISDPYEAPTDAEIVVNSSGTPPEELVDQIFIRIKKMGFIK
ncbi:MAG: adenylyl-sulfate kinase, partial [Candidatus Marinimicrobia bacterium]|nr:adenylyl-sulfate kinase [Candidatus Neomarinimicrobiota bacterium]